MLKRTVFIMALVLIMALPVLAFAGTVELPETGQTTCYDSLGNVIACTGTGQDGDIRAGVAWPSPRFTDNGNGTVTDNLTGLMWLKNANCFGAQTWTTALNAANTLNSGECGLMDGSAAGDWRLPNRKELHSLTDFSRSNPALPSGHPFLNVQSNVQSNGYWSSTSRASYAYGAWVVGMWDGGVGVYGKSSSPPTCGQFVPVPCKSRCKIPPRLPAQFPSTAVLHLRTQPPSR